MSEAQKVLFALHRDSESECCQRLINFLLLTNTKLDALEELTSFSVVGIVSFSRFVRLILGRESICRSRHGLFHIENAYMHILIYI